MTEISCSHHQEKLCEVGAVARLHLTTLPHHIFSWHN